MARYLTPSRTALGLLESAELRSDLHHETVEIVLVWDVQFAAIRRIVLCLCLFQSRRDAPKPAQGGVT